MKKLSFLFVLGLLAACQTLPTSSEWLARGDGYAKDGKLDAAIKSYTRAATLNPKDASIYAARGAAYFTKGEYALATQDFIETLQLNPYHVDTYNALATALAVQGDYKNAMEMINRVLLVAPDKPEIFFTRGGINFMLGKYNQAVQDYSFVLNTHPAADVYQARAMAYAKLGDTKKSQADIQAAQSGKYMEKLSDYQLLRK